MNKIYLVQGSSGWYDDYHTYPVKAFSSEKFANDYISKYYCKYDQKIDEEYQELAIKYLNGVEEPEFEESDSIWEAYDSVRCDAEEKAFKEISEKYPDYNLNTTEDFHGYHIVEIDYE